MKDIITDYHCSFNTTSNLIESPKNYCEDYPYTDATACGKVRNKDGVRCYFDSDISNRRCSTPANVYTACNHPGASVSECE